MYTQVLSITVLLLVKLIPKHLKLLGISIKRYLSQRYYMLQLMQCLLWYAILKCWDWTFCAIKSPYINISDWFFFKCWFFKEVGLLWKRKKKLYIHVLTYREYIAIAKQYANHNLHNWHEHLNSDGWHRSAVWQSTAVERQGTRHHKIYVFWRVKPTRPFLPRLCHHLVPLLLWFVWDPFQLVGPAFHKLFWRFLLQLGWFLMSMTPSRIFLWYSFGVLFMWLGPKVCWFRFQANLVVVFCLCCAYLPLHVFAAVWTIYGCFSFSPVFVCIRWMSNMFQLQPN